MGRGRSREQGRFPVRAVLSWADGLGGHAVEVTWEQNSELDQSAAHHPGHRLQCRFPGPAPETLAYVICGKPGNLHFNRCPREFPWEHWPQSIWEFFPTLRFLEKETICAPVQDQSKLPKSSRPSRSSRDGALEGRLSGLPTCPRAPASGSADVCCLDAGLCTRAAVGSRMSPLGLR